MKFKQLLGWMVVWLTSSFFLQNGLQKLIGTDMMIQLFQELGYSDWFRVMIGLFEVVGAAFLSIPRFTRLTSIGLGLLMLGAVGSEMISGRFFEALIAGQWFVLFMVIAYVRNKYHTKILKRRNLVE